MMVRVGFFSNANAWDKRLDGFLERERERENEPETETNAV